MNELITFLLSITQGLGYLGVFILMAVESSFIPFPSEIVVPPAGYLAATGSMNLFLVIFSGVTGSLFGALINYYLAFFLGRKFAYSFAKLKIAKYLMISEENLLKSENLIRKYGSSSTFFGRLLPAVRQLISIPAGFSKMNLFCFLFFTCLGATLWVTVLALLGYFFGQNQELLHKYYSEFTYAFIFIVMGILILYLVKRKFSKRS
jgi:membrane protein DedA with SNARE-associated domain